MTFFQTASSNFPNDNFTSAGVPAAARRLTVSFAYNDLDSLTAIFAAYPAGIAAVVLEAETVQPPESDFFSGLRELCDREGALLILDEIITGFRWHERGAQYVYDIQPDLATFGKALGNGYAITATIGRREVMEAAQSTFISSTFWTERIGPTAALKTLEVMEREKSWETITNTGLYIRDEWQKLADKHGLSISHWGLPALTGFSFVSENALAYKTLITQEMLAKGYLAGTSVYVCTEHTKQVVDACFDVLDPVFGLVKQCEEGRDVMSLLKGPICHGGFKRLN